MLKLTRGQKIYALPLHYGALSGSFTLDENWRDLDYSGGGSALDLTMTAFYNVPESSLADLLHIGLVDDEEQPLLNLELEIGHTRWDHQLHRSVLVGNQKRFSSLPDLVDLRLTPAICENSTLWFPGGASPAHLQSIEFGSVQSSQIDVQFSGWSSDIGGQLEFQMQDSLPFQISVRIEHASHVFNGMGLEKRLDEIRQCFASLYDATRYSAKENVIDAADNSVEIIFRPVNSTTDPAQ